MAFWLIAFVLTSAEYVLTSSRSGGDQPLSILVTSDFTLIVSPALDAIALILMLANSAHIGLGDFICRRSQKK